MVIMRGRGQSQQLHISTQSVWAPGAGYDLDSGGGATGSHFLLHNFLHSMQLQLSHRKTSKLARLLLTLK